MGLTKWWKVEFPGYWKRHDRSGADEIVPDFGRGNVTRHGTIIPRHASLTPFTESVGIRNLFGYGQPGGRACEWQRELVLHWWRPL